MPIWDADYWSGGVVDIAGRMFGLSDQVDATKNTLTGTINTVGDVAQTMGAVYKQFGDTAASIMVTMKWGAIGLVGIIGLFFIVWIVRFAFGRGPDVAGQITQVLDNDTVRRAVQTVQTGVETLDKIPM